MGCQEQEIIELLTEEFEDDARYSDMKNPVATTWLISFRQIQQRDPLAAEYMSFMACIDHKDVPQLLLLLFLPEAPIYNTQLAVGGSYAPPLEIARNLMQN